MRSSGRTARAGVAAARGILSLIPGLLLPCLLQAQVGQFTIPPSGIIPNYNRIGIGQREALEGGAYVARTDDALANWYNPAGLVSSEKTALNASSNAYELTKTTLNGVGQKKLEHEVQPDRRFLRHRGGSADCQEPAASIGLRLYQANRLVPQQPGRRLHPAGRRGYRGVWL